MSSKSGLRRKINFCPVTLSGKSGLRRKKINFCPVTLSGNSGLRRKFFARSLAKYHRDFFLSTGQIAAKILGFPQLF